MQTSSIVPIHSVTDTIDPIMLMVRSSPLTTVSSCGAVEDFDENLSVRHTETPLNDDDECVSIASANSLKTILSSPSRNRANAPSAIVSKNAFDLNSSATIPINKTNHIKTPLGSGIQITLSSAIGTETRITTPRSLRRRASKTPDSSAAEENYEGINFYFCITFKI